MNLLEYPNTKIEQIYLQPPKEKTERNRGIEN